MMSTAGRAYWLGVAVGLFIGVFGTLFFLAEHGYI